MIDTLSPRENPILVKRPNGAVVKEMEEAEESRGRDRKREGEAEEILASRDVALGRVRVSGFGIEDQPAENARPSFQHLVRCTGMSMTQWARLNEVKYRHNNYGPVSDQELTITYVLVQTINCVSIR